MAIIVTKGEEKYAVLGAGIKLGNIGASEEPYFIATNKDGKIELFADFADNVKVIEIDGKTPEELLK